MIKHPPLVLLLCSLNACQFDHAGLSKPRPEPEPEADTGLPPAPAFDAGRPDRPPELGRAPEPDAAPPPDAAPAADLAPDLATDRAPAADAGPAAIALDLAAMALSRAYCQRRFECCTRDEIGPATANDRATCEAETFLELDSTADDVAAGVSRRRVLYDGARLVRELDAWLASDCRSARDRSPWTLLDKALAPLVPAGGACRRNWECKDGYCPDWTPGEDGHCVAPRLADGGPCFSDDECRSGFCPAGECAPAPGNLLCLPGSP